MWQVQTKVRPKIDGAYPGRLGEVVEVPDFDQVLPLIQKAHDLLVDDLGFTSVEQPAQEGPDGYFHYETADSEARVYWRFLE